MGKGWRQVHADDCGALVDVNVVRPVDAAWVQLVPVAQLHDTVDNAARVGGPAQLPRAMFAVAPLTIVPEPSV